MADLIQNAAIYTHPKIEAGNGVCATGNPLSAAAGVRIMQQGGNAFDAMVGAAFTTFVMEPESCGLGGYGHISAYVAKTHEFISIDAYCRAPLQSHAKMFDIDTTRPPSYYGHPFTKDDLAYVGALAVAVPGAVIGFCELHELLGRLPLKQVLLPAIEAAEEGVPVMFWHRLAILDELDRIRQFSDAAGALLNDGRAPAMQKPEGGGDKLDTSVLAGVLKQIAKHGKRVFRSGRIVKSIVDHVRSHGGILSMQDFATYRPRLLRETPAIYRKHEYVSCYDQVAYETLNILGQFDLHRYGADSFAYRHLTAEALAVAFTDNMTHYGDPDFIAAPVDGLSSQAYAMLRRKQLRMTRALPRPVVAGDPWPFERRHVKPDSPMGMSTSVARRHGTSQVAVADKHGNLASACVSIGSNYGSLMFVPEVGIFMNNAMQNFDPRPEHPSHIEPGKMPIFAAPAIVASRGGEGRFAASGSGGYRIEPGVLQVMMNHIDHRMPVQRAVDHPRVHCQGRETFVDARIDAQILARLQKAGHELCVLNPQPGANHFGRVSAVTRNPKNKTLSAGGGAAWQTGLAGF